MGNLLRLGGIASMMSAFLTSLPLLGATFDNACRLYANQTVKQIDERLRLACGRGNTPASWWRRSTWKGHYNWCVAKMASGQAGGGPWPEIAVMKRNKVLAKCRAHDPRRRSVIYYYPRWERLTRSGRKLYGKRSCGPKFYYYGRKNGKEWCYYCPGFSRLTRVRGKLLCKGNRHGTRYR